jgi:DNA-binding XRE family transcriptional regulator
MDRRRKHIDPDAERDLRERFYQDIEAGRLSIPSAIKTMRRISRLTLSEFARHRGISVGALKQLESGKGNPKVETLRKIGEIFGLGIGFVAPSRPER